MKDKKENHTDNTLFFEARQSVFTPKGFIPLLCHVPVSPRRLDIRAIVDRLRMSKDTQSNLPALLRKNRVVSYQKLCNRQSKAEPLGNDGMEYQHGPAILGSATGAGDKTAPDEKGSKERWPVIVHP